jgi:hypothetical protein
MNSHESEKQWFPQVERGDEVMAGECYNGNILAEPRYLMAPTPIDS